MPILSWFSKKRSDEDYEQILASLALSIHKRQTKLSEIRLRERRATLLVTTWALAAWAAYVGLWWAGFVGGRGERRRGGILGGVPVVLGPVVILFTRRLVQLWYARKGNTEEKTLKKLLVQQRNKIEEIKRKTNYYTTKNLLDRYEDGPARRPSDSSGMQRGGPPTPAQSQRQQQHEPNGSSTPTGSFQAPQTPSRGGGGPQGDSFSPSLATLPAPRKQWYDKLADALLGDDSTSAGSPPTSRYALICERCFSHNGLVKEDQWENTQYLCPKCGHFNPSARVRKAGFKAGLTSPSSPQSAIPQSVVPAISQGFPSASMASSPLASSTYGQQQSPSLPHPARREPSPKSALSASTVFVEKDDAGDGKKDKNATEQGSNGGDEKTIHMEVDL